MSNLLENSVVNQELGDQRTQKGNADSQTEATAGAIECPPQANGKSCQSQRQLNIVGKIHFLMQAEVKDQAECSEMHLHTRLHNVQLHQLPSKSLNTNFLELKVTLCALLTSSMCDLKSTLQVYRGNY